MAGEPSHGPRRNRRGGSCREGFYNGVRLRYAGSSVPFAGTQPTPRDRTAMGTKSQFFRAFVEGQTISDGRVVTADMINQSVETFNTETYTPGINVEHLSGFSPEPPFNRYGDVIAVRAQTDDITIAGKTEKRRALYAQVDALDQLVNLARASQKPFPSVELTPDYAGSGKVGLVGLAFTDNPASIATQKLSFSRSAPGTIFSSGNEPVTLEFEPKPIEPAGIADAIKAGFAGVAAMFSRTEPEKPKEEPKKPANDNFDPAAFATALGDSMATTIAALIKPVTDAQTKMQQDYAALQGKLESTEQPGFKRAPATGGSGAVETDC
ncbi:GPO family capsid scaffolding protein [Sphingomonas sp. QA11]|uniref:GPO family capsid scaffolding protein n=1 Tax=Sphingomonas sp. QA11 TaxID=2950605 RepID=UPI0023499776|nr:GPO family capsid scaffolding protein [Sphingomonas sp. QA11]WCM29180.1 GPO family capsid scaffolding protein [Sphingomonas sp. QA11]